MSYTNYRHFWSCGASTLLATLAMQGAQPANSPTATDTAQLEEVVVTAQKKVENLQKASIAVAVLSPDDLAKQGITNAIDLQEVLPAVRFVAADQMTVSIRGLGTTNDNPGVDSAVAYSQDGIYAAHPMALTPVLFDIKRVEALLGPQGTLYGRNSNGGVINFITNDPESEFGGYAKVGFGNYGAITSEVALNLPLGDSWSLRIAGGSERHNPYDQDGSNDVSALAGRVKLQYRPDENLRLLFTVDAAKRDSQGASYGGICPPNNANPNCAGIAWVPWSGLPPEPKSALNNDSIYGASITVDYNLGWAGLTSLTGYKAYDFEVDTSPGWYNGVASFDYLHPESNRFFTQEVRLANRPDARIVWVAGAYYSHETQPTSFVQFNYSHSEFLGIPPGLFQKLNVESYTANSAAVFGDVTLPISDRFRFRGGLRYTYESKDLLGTFVAGLLGPPEFLFGPPQVNTGSQATSKVTWKAGVDFDVTPENLLYATVSTGFKSGGTNNLPAAAVGLTTYDPETITAIEIGSKNRFLNNRLQINASLFHYDYKGYQTFAFYRPQSGPLANSTLFPTLNSQTATFEGGELQADLALTASDKFGLSLNILTNKFDQFVVDLPFDHVIDLSNTDVFLSPRSQVGLRYEHKVTRANGDVFSLAVNTQFVASTIAQGDQGAFTGNSPYTQSSYHKTGANLTYRMAESGWTFSAFARNLENKAVINSVAGGYPVFDNFFHTNAMIDPPRTFGMSVGKQF
jgi:iron complex outermembrane recepter protein